MNSSNEYQFACCKKRKCISLEVKIDIIKKHTEQKITTSKLAKEYNVNASIISTILSSKAKILKHYEKNLAELEKKRINKQVINSKEAIDRINELKQFFLTKKDDNSNIFLSIFVSLSPKRDSNTFESNEIKFFKIVGSKFYNKIGGVVNLVSIRSFQFRKT
ncbi:hypothetical protein BpHYR1_014498 [Brachionus plicatilis]|uniref:HTH psq-type domain-containing protein n=1 Tax=Brachionus plicatilis TaxID=10195 RepID=A0A3M7QF76_BRAPC|nr:hypothetical protein BpHYR1_014498 [Brachionus plicatilis]